MDIDEIFKVIGRLYLESQTAINRLVAENEKLKEQLQPPEKVKK